MIAARTLSGSVLGRGVIVSEGGFSVTGTLAGVDHRAYLIRDDTAGGQEYVTLGRKWVHLSFLNGAEVTVSPEAQVTVL